jgi:hypothetical protein
VGVVVNAKAKYELAFTAVSVFSLYGFSLTFEDLKYRLLHARIKT